MICIRGAQLLCAPLYKYTRTLYGFIFNDTFLPLINMRCDDTKLEDKIVMVGDGKSQSREPFDRSWCNDSPMLPFIVVLLWLRLLYAHTRKRKINKVSPASTSLDCTIRSLGSRTFLIIVKNKKCQHRQRRRSNLRAPLMILNNIKLFIGKLNARCGESEATAKRLPLSISHFPYYHKTALAICVRITCYVSRPSSLLFLFSFACSVLVACVSFCLCWLLTFLNWDLKGSKAIGIN